MLLPVIARSPCDEAIHAAAKEEWIASSQGLLAMTAVETACLYGGGGFVIGFFCAKAATVEVPIGPCSS